MKRWIFVIFLLAIVLTMSACGSQQEKAEQACVVGTWQLIDMEAYARALLPPDAFEQDKLKFNGGAGLLGYTFKENGDVGIQALNWMGQFSVAVDNALYRLDLQIEGIASGTYHLENDMLSVDSVKSTDLSYLAVFDEETMVDTFQANEFAPLFVPEYNQARFECTETTLKLFLINQPGINQPMVFQRVVQQQE